MIVAQNLSLSPARVDAKSFMYRGPMCYLRGTNTKNHRNHTTKMIQTQHTENKERKISF